MFQPVGVAPVLRRCCGWRRDVGCPVSSAACTCADCAVALALVRGLQRTRGYRQITHPLSSWRWEGYQWIELNESFKECKLPAVEYTQP